jgi:hypothetical protein
LGQTKPAFDSIRRKARIFTAAAEYIRDYRSRIAVVSRLVPGHEIRSLGASGNHIQSSWDDLGPFVVPWV